MQAVIDFFNCVKQSRLAKKAAREVEAEALADAMKIQRMYKQGLIPAEDADAILSHVDPESIKLDINFYSPSYMKV